MTPKNPVLVDTKKVFYLIVDGKGAPGSDEFTTTGRMRRLAK